MIAHESVSAVMNPVVDSVMDEEVPELTMATNDKEILSTALVIGSNTGAREASRGRNH